MALAHLFSYFYFLVSPFIDDSSERVSGLLLSQYDFSCQLLTFSTLTVCMGALRHECEPECWLSAVPLLVLASYDVILHLTASVPEMVIKTLWVALGRHQYLLPVSF